MKEPLYVYIKSDKYNEYKVVRDADEEVTQVNEIFETEEDMMQFVIDFSNYYSIPVQFYF